VHVALLRHIASRTNWCQ